MPGIPGPALARQVTAARPETRVLYMSGYPQDILDQRGVLEPGTALLQKPFRAEALVRTMREVLRGPTA
jgi:DNA-binding NarL/FixJ family response regulator